MNIQAFKVFKLHGKHNFDIKLTRNSLVLVAENGSGKTTLVSMFYYFLSRQWRKLNEFNFEKVILVVNDVELVFEKKNYKDTILRHQRIHKRWPTKFAVIADQILSEYKIEDLRRNYDLVEKLSLIYEVPSRFVADLAMIYREEEHRIDFDNRVKLVEESLTQMLGNTQIIYLPTYRRIEKDLKNIFPHLEDSMKEFEFKRRRRASLTDDSSFIELVEFGMDDVKERLEKKCSELKSHFYNNLTGKITGSYLEDILNKTYKNFDSSKINDFDDKALEYLLKRLDDSVISEQGKNSLKEFVERVKHQPILDDEDKINAYFVWKLFQIYKDQQNQEIDINKFVQICNDYIGGGKEFKYDNDSFKVDIFLPDEFVLEIPQLTLAFSEKEISKNEKSQQLIQKKIDYKDLSSGEKQIVSLFSHLLLSSKKYFVIIDEPELSLSVPWQERFLPDILNSGECIGIMAVTHSPFIFKNEMRSFSRGLEEFKLG